MAPRPGRFSGLLDPVQRGTVVKRTGKYRSFCGKHSPPIPGFVKKFLRKMRKESHNDVAAIIRAYTSEDAVDASGEVLYNLVNKALRENKYEEMKQFGGIIHAMRLALKKECRNNNKNVEHGTVYRKMSLTIDQSKQYQVGFRFLWPNLVSTSRRSDLQFGEDGPGYVKVTFIINLAGPGKTFALDIAKYSVYPDEKEVLIYPFSGFEVMRREGNKIYLRTVGTAIVEPGTDLCPTGSMPSLY